ncbi:RNA polymerase sigma factor RpoD/SigA [Mucilaginibacter sp. ZT4R22]|uniref:RNA polymerase sigma factor RpoD/SigA n=1 Tax=Mucilaginibacter pankratovii TaxID=2772110 RepID=A0ABR7WVG4_9SPHI|nr:RNA polymerase sigma factor RpoD/SigA [Mucilaginibacter pankratovii]MBD1365404.1 RNA polymerase sigma factor RpoD/SigA [Mucilaginibacter pankratovii]
MKQLVISKSITNREYESLSKYFSEVNKIDLLSTKEEVSLMQRIKNGDQAALERLTKANLRFVISVAKQYQSQGLTLGDLINEGNIGLITAAKRYDETRGFKFISYAVWWIRQSISSAIADHARTVRLPLSQLRLLSQLYKASAKIEQQQGRKPSIEELAESIDITVEKVAELINKSGVSVSIDEPLKGEEGYNLLDVLQSNDLKADDDIVRESATKEIYSSLTLLDEREREVLFMFFGLRQYTPSSLEEIGTRLNVTKEHVGRLKAKALRKLRNSTNAGSLLS